LTGNGNVRDTTYAANAESAGSFSSSQNSVREIRCGRHRAGIAKQIEVNIPTARVQRHVDVLNEDRDKVAKVRVRTDTNGQAK
jgi:hypothetical protein